MVHRILRCYVRCREGAGRSTAGGCRPRLSSEHRLREGKAGDRDDQIHIRIQIGAFRLPVKFAVMLPNGTWRANATSPPALTEL